MSRIEARVRVSRFTAVFSASLWILAASGCGGGKTVTPTPPVDRIAVAQPTITITGIGQSQNIVATPQGRLGQTLNVPVSWQSSNPSVATVSGTTSSAVVTSTGVGTDGSGTATITATADGKTGQIEVTVIARVNSINASATSIALNLGEVKPVSATVQADPGISTNVIWQSGNPSVATVPSAAVASGAVVNVTGVSPGNTVLRARSQADSLKFRDVSVVVTGPPDACSALVLSPAQATLSGPGATQVITTTATLGSGATVSYTNTTSDASIATVTGTGANPTVTAVTPLKVGQATITIKATCAGPGLTTNEITRTVAVSTPAVASVQVTLGSTSLTTGQTTQATAVPRDAGGVALTGRGAASWSSSTPDVASVDAASGTLTAIGAGTTQVTATIAGVAATAPPTLTVASPAFVSITADGDHTCGRTSDNLTFCWGRNFDGQIGDGTTIARKVPTKVVGGHAFVEVTNGHWQTCGRTEAGTAYCWGRGLNGDLGDGTRVSKSVPTLVLGGQSYSQITMGAFFSCGRTGVGSAFCWGYNGPGSLGDGTTVDKLVPTAVAGGVVFAALTAGEIHTCGRTGGGATYCWGNNNFGQVGDGTRFNNRLTPVRVASAFTIIDIVAGEKHTCARTNVATTYCWGRNAYGELGDGTLNDNVVPTLVSGGHVFNETVANTQTCGRTATGTVYCWGRNDNGQLGDGTTTNRSVPTLVSGGMQFAQIAAGKNHTCGRTSAGAVYCWGLNDQGQLGDGTTTNRTIPTLVK